MGMVLTLGSDKPRYETSKQKLQRWQEDGCSEPIARLLIDVLNQ